MAMKSSLENNKMTKEREYDTYCAYKGTMVVKSGYNQGGLLLMLVKIV